MDNSNGKDSTTTNSHKIDTSKFEIDDDDEMADTTDDENYYDNEFDSNFNFTDINFEDIQNSMKTREDFMKEIFGHRKNMKLLDREYLIQLQDNDQCIKAIKNVTTLYYENQDKYNEDMETIRKCDYKLYKHVLNDDIKIANDGLVTINVFDIYEKLIVNKIVIPFVIRGKLIDYAHHSTTAHHNHARQTIFNLRNYYWSTLRKDVKKFIKRCIPCQFVKGSITHRTPLTQRPLPKPCEHIFVDFLGPIYGKYYILVIVDYATGYIMLTPVIGCDRYVVLHTLLNKWIPIFGWFKTFESDWGSGFNNRLIETLLKLTGVNVQFTEPGGHRASGKVERPIGFVQQLLNLYNILLDNHFTNRIDKIDKSWQIIEILIPMIQFHMNQRRFKFNQYSPNILMFGKNMNDLSDIGRMESELIKLQDNNETKMANHDFKHLRNLIKHLKRMNGIFEQDWKKYVWFNDSYHRKRHNITDKKIENYRNKFKVGTQVLYYVGDRQVALRKWKNKWTGPWIIEKIINNTSLIIADPTSGNEKRVNFDRIKLFNKLEFDKYEDVITSNNYINYQKDLLNKVRSYNVKIRGKDVQLDYNERNIHYEESPAVQEVQN